ncbi:hypothetical protein TKK_0007955 [Trichogramma kaykai]
MFVSSDMANIKHGFSLIFLDFRFLFNFEQALGDWYHNSNVTREQMNNLLSILIRAGHDDLHRDIRSIVKTPKKTIITPCSPGEYYHRGLQNALVNILKSRKLPSKIVIDINIDGLPISKSSKRTLWSIQGLIVGELTPFVIGVYHGFKKPSSIEDHLRPFINEYKNLRSEGFNFRENSYKVKLRCVICDSPARSFCSNTKQFNGYFGCSKCVVEGSWRKKVVFLEANLTLRTNESFRNRSQPEHHLGYSPFEELEIDMVDQFPIDYMHTALLGVTKMLIKLWINFKPRFSYNQTETLSENFLNLSKYIPQEFSRKPQSCFELNWWKATTCRLFLLYCGPIILNESLPDDFVLHFNCLSLATRILCDPAECHRNANNANLQLNYFFDQFKHVYAEEYVTSNVHALIHLTDCVKLYGPLDTFSAFPFENNMKFMKNLLRKHEKSLQQIHRRLEENRQPSCKRNNKGSQNPKLIQRSYQQLPYRCTDAHKKLKFTNFELSTVPPDNCCVMNDGIIVTVEHIGKMNNVIVVIGKRFTKTSSIKNYPIDSRLIGICKVEKQSQLEVYPVSLIKNKVCLFNFKDHMYAVPLLH